MKLLITYTCPVCHGEKGFAETVVYDGGKKIKTIHEICMNCSGVGKIYREIECEEFAVLDQ